MDASLASLDLAIQSDVGAGTQLSNAIMASTPEHPLWLAYMRFMVEHVALASSPWLRNGDLILNSTGPIALTAAFCAASSIAQGNVLTGEHSLSFDVPAWPAASNGSLAQHIARTSSVHIYPVGSWYQPCSCRDTACFGRVDDTYMHSTLDPAIVGLHTCAAGWLASLKARNWATVIAGIAAGLALLAGLLWVLHLCAGRPAPKAAKPKRTQEHRP